MSGIKSAIAWPNGKVYFFDKQTTAGGGATDAGDAGDAGDGGVSTAPGTTYTRYDFVTGAQDQTAQDIATYWPGISTRPDAAVYWGVGKVYFFYGSSYVRFDIKNNSVDPDYTPNPRPIAGNWQLPWTDRIDAAVNWGNGKLYFFRDGQYARYDITLERTDDGYPLPIAGNWDGVWADKIDAVLYQGGQFAYFFQGNDFRRFNLETDTVDQNGQIGALSLDPVPAGLWTPGRELTLDQANAVVGYLAQSGKFTLSRAQTAYAGDWRTGITSPKPSTHVVVQPAKINGVDFVYDGGASPLIDNLDQRMLVVLYRLTRWLNASEPDVATIRHKGIGHGSGPANDCHNQGRALDFSGLDGTSSDAAFDRKILRDWGNRPVVAGVAMRLDPSVDRLAHDLFRTAFCFGTFECECNGMGTANKWPAKVIGDTGGFVIHPDYIDSPGDNLRSQHQDHIHMQVGPTRA